VTLHLLRDPLAWLGLTLVATAWPLLASFAPIGLTTTDRSPAGTIYEFAFWASALGAALGLPVLVRGRWFLAPLASPRRLLVEAAGMATALLLFVVPALGVAALFGSTPTPDLLLGLLLTGLHLVAVGLVLLRAPLGPAAVGLGLPLLVWALPALLAGAAAPGPAVARWLAANQHLAFTSAGDPASTQVGTAALPIIGLVLAAGLLHRPDALRRPG